MGELIFNALLLIFFIVMMFSAQDIVIWNDYVGARVWPTVLLAIAIIIFAIKVFRIWKSLPKEDLKFNLVETFGLNKPGIRKLLITFALLIAYVLILPYGGFIFTTTAFAAVLSYLLGSNSIPKSLLTGIGVIVPIYIIFAWGLGVRVPRGVGIIYDISFWIETLVR